MARAHLIDEPTRARAAAAPIALRRPHPSYGTRVPWYTEQVRALVASALPGDARARRPRDRDGGAAGARHARSRPTAVAHADRWGKAQVAALVWDHRTGYVEALVGGRAWGPRPLRSHAAELPPAGLGVEAARLRRRARGAARSRRAPRCATRRSPSTTRRTNVHWKPKLGQPVPRRRARAGRVRGVAQRARDRRVRSRRRPARDRARAPARHLDARSPTSGRWRSARRA